ncbi:MAG: penicillin-binding protein [Candidatus Magasanikbacteria bacterium]|nr:penicillin-binding protein [Candidatus Magasanikbacteria bacterium]
MPIPQLNQRRQYGHIPGSEPWSSPEKRKKLLKTAGLAAAAIFCASFIIGTITIAIISRDLPDPNKLNDRRVSQSTKIYDRTGEHLLYEVYHNQKRTLVNLDQISDYAKQATVAIEDKHFYEHSGVRVVSIIRAGFNNLIGRKSGSGGASTITQQVIKNTIVGDERRGIWGYFRKIKEAILAVRLEKKYTKDEILKLYLNEIPYGSTNYGIESASQSYFQKSAKDLTLAEAATLAAILPSPSRFLKNLDALRDRRDVVLALMYDQGMITEEQKKEAQGVALRIFKSGGPMEAPHFVLYVKQLLAEEFGEKTVDGGGLKIITSLDYDKQKAAEAIVKELGDKNAKTANANNAALVAIDPKTGQILTLVGSRDYNNDEINGQFDVATLGKRQPGSSFKPFVYTLAFEKGYTPDTVLYDVTTNFDARAGANYTPKNFDGKEHGLVTIRRALQGSLNIPAVKTMYLVGTKNTIDFAKRFGYTTFTGDYGLSLVLGGGEVNLLEHTNGYATLANNGVYNKPVSILKVTDPTGEVLYEWKPEENEGQNTPSIVAGVWVGNTVPTSMKAGGNALAGTIWNKFMKEAVKGTPVEYFPAPPPNDAQKPVLRGGNNGITLKINSETGKIASSSTPENLITERTYLPPHDILHYVDREDPRGPAPPFPADDPQYLNWEQALQVWVVKLQSSENVTFLEPPTEYDSELAAELAPKIEFISPVEGVVLTSREMNIETRATAPGGVSKIIYQIDNQPIGTATEFPFTLNYYAQKLSKGPHTLSAVAVDDAGHSSQKSITFAMQADFDPPNFEWFDSGPLTLRPDDYPRVFNIVPFRWDDMKKIDIYLSSNGGSQRLIYNFNHQEDKLFNNMLTFTWKNSPGAGEHSLKAVLLDNFGNTVEKTLQVNIE